MIGLIPQIFLGFMRAQRGAAGVAECLRAVDLPEDHHFSIGELFDDTSWQRLFSAGAEICGLDRSTADYRFGRYAADDLARRFPGFAAGVSSLREMLLRQVQIHHQLARSMRDPVARRQVAQKFEVVEEGDALVIRYRSPNDHLDLYRGAADRFAELFDERVTLVAEDHRTGSGADYVLRLKFHGRPAGAPA